MNMENILQINKGKLEDVNMQLVEFENSRILTDHVQKSPRTMFCSAQDGYNYMLKIVSEDGPNSLLLSSKSSYPSIQPGIS